MNICELKATAELANLHLTEEELGSLGNEVQKILDYFSKMREADALITQEEKAAVNQETQANNMKAGKGPAPQRRDEQTKDIDADVILQRAPELEDRFIVIPNVL